MFLPGVLRNGGFGLAHWPRHARRLVLSALVGVVAGLGAVFFDSLLVQSLTWLVEVPMAWARHGIAFQSAPGLHTPIVSWIIIPIAGLGGLASGLLVFCIAPEAEGHGTDAMIESFHLRGGYVRKRAPIIKFIASALTIGSGGSAGKEGPIAQIGSGFGSILATFLKLDTADRRVLLLAGAAGGIGAIFQAPLGAALFVPGVLYRDTEYEFEALLSCIIASISAYAVFSQVFGRQALFTPGPVHFAMPVELLPCLIFGVLCAAAGYIYIKVFYGLRDHFFKPLPIPRMLKPAIGGLLLGCVAWQFPEVIDGGYVWIQTALDGKMLWQTMAALVLLKMVATSFTIASGGSGGVFGPSVFIGAMLGGAFGELGHALFPNLVVNPGSFVLIGMGGFFFRRGQGAHRLGHHGQRNVLELHAARAAASGVHHHLPAFAPQGDALRKADGQPAGLAGPYRRIRPGHPVAHDRGRGHPPAAGERHRREHAVSRPDKGRDQFHGVVFSGGRQKRPDDGHPFGQRPARGAFRRQPARPRGGQGRGHRPGGPRARGRFPGSGHGHHGAAANRRAARCGGRPARRDRGHVVQAGHHRPLPRLLPDLIRPRFVAETSPVAPCLVRALGLLPSRTSKEALCSDTGSPPPAASWP
ncbi:chloride channel protein [Desulfovibrio sp. JY]|nr:chloride channel protein [Desulfovibrio sp. JY]